MAIQQADYMVYEPLFVSMEGVFKEYYYPQLSTLRSRIMLEAAVDPTLLGRMMAATLFTKGEFRTQVGREGWVFLHNDDRVPKHPLSSFPSPPGLSPCNLASQSPVDVPWGWTEALNRTTDLWGDRLFTNIPRIFVGYSDWSREMALRYFAEDWRWAGVVFWDKDRAKTITKHLTNDQRENCPNVDTGTGWLQRQLE